MYFDNQRSYTLFKNAANIAFGEEIIIVRMILSSFFNILFPVPHRRSWDLSSKRLICLWLRLVCRVASAIIGHDTKMYLLASTKASRAATDSPIVPSGSVPGTEGVTNTLWVSTNHITRYSRFRVFFGVSLAGIWQRFCQFPKTQKF